VTNKDPNEIEEVECEQFPVFRRTNYFFGKLLEVSDFKTEQKYFINKQRLMNRLIHGTGIICGLNVLKKGPSAMDLQENQIRVTEGVALDYCGREIIVPNSVDIDLSENLKSEDKTTPLYIWIKYDFCGEQKVPRALESTDLQEDYVYSKIKESYKFGVGKKPPKTSENSSAACTNEEGLVEHSERIEFSITECPELSEGGVLVLAKITGRRKDGTFFVSQVNNLARNEEGAHRQSLCSNAHLFNMITRLRKRIGELENTVESIREERKMSLGKRIENWLKALEL
jgi:hypothetical protein